MFSKTKAVETVPGAQDGMTLISSGAIIHGNVYCNVNDMAKGAQLNGSMGHYPDSTPKQPLGLVRNSEATGQVIEG